jgi:hypothetical protein
MNATDFLKKGCVYKTLAHFNPPYYIKTISKDSFFICLTDYQNSDYKYTEYFVYQYQIYILNENRKIYLHFAADSYINNEPWCYFEKII